MVPPLRPVLVALCVLLLVQSGMPEFVVEKGKLKVHQRDGNVINIEMALGDFGNPQYGGFTSGYLVYPKTEYYKEDDGQCFITDEAGQKEKIDCRFGCVPFDEATPPLLPLHGMQGKKKAGMMVPIMVLDRGPEGDRACKFTEKAYNAQKAGAAAVIMVNYRDEFTTMDSAQGDDETEAYIGNLTIPASLIKKSDGDRLKQMLIKPDGSYPSYDDMEHNVLVTMSWEDILPRRQKVEWQFWTNSNDVCGDSCDKQRKFIKDFAPYAKKLDQDELTDFSPHYLIWVCPAQYRNTPQCQQQCIYGGNYCCPDPEDDMTFGYEGKDVILENLRQLCVFKMANSTGKPWLWWDFTTKYGEQCPMDKAKEAENPEFSYGEQCAERVYREVGGELWDGSKAGLPNGLAGLRKCVGSYDQEGENAMLEAEKNAQVGSAETSEVSILPTVRINNAQYRGALRAKEVMKAICAAFKLDEEPSVCNMEWVSENECLPGEKGALECAANVDTGMTGCRNTFSGYECECGDGFLSKHDPDGTLQCLDLNECKGLNIQDPDCTCERCACHNLRGGYRCEANIEDVCHSEDKGGCWKGEVNGVEYNACYDLLTEYKELALEGTASSTTPKFKCQCPPCFNEIKGDDGKISCEPKENFELCDPKTGDYRFVDATGRLTPEVEQVVGRSSGLGVVSILLISCAVVVVAVAAAYGVYRLQRRNHMDAEIRAIMAQYMPLDKDEELNHTTGISHRSSPREGNMHQRMV